MGILNMVYGSGSGGGGGYKSYAELKAMTLSDVIEELNTDAQGYYDNLNGNGKILGIGIGNSDNTTYQCWDVSPVIFWNGSWRNGEIIIAKIKTDSSGNLMIPKAGYSLSAAQNASYNWWVSYDGGSEIQYSGTGSAGSITIASGLTPDTEHTIVIRPNSESYGWARAFGFYKSGVQGLLNEVIYDGSYKGYSSNSTNTGSDFRFQQYRGCTSLLTAPQEVLPDSVTTIGNDFRGGQYRGCTSLLTAPQEVLPDSVTTIGNDFRNYQYEGCTSLTKAPQEVLPNSVISLGGHFRNYQYSGCTSLIEASQEVFPDTIHNTNAYFRNYQYEKCTSLRSAPKEVLPDTVTTIGTYFRSYQYRNCSNLIEIQGTKDLNIGGTYYRTSQFYSCNSMKTVKVLSDVGYAWYNANVLSNSYVAVVFVPSAYLSNFKDATTQPRTSIDDSKFVGY